jgi:hypothetical protein
MIEHGPDTMKPKPTAYDWWNFALNDIRGRARVSLSSPTSEATDPSNHTISLRSVAVSAFHCSVQSAAPQPLPPEKLAHRQLSALRPLLQYSLNNVCGAGRSSCVLDLRGEGFEPLAKAVIRQHALDLGRQGLIVPEGRHPLTYATPKYT